MRPTRRAVLRKAFGCASEGVQYHGGTIVLEVWIEHQLVGWGAVDVCRYERPTTYAGRSKRCSAEYRISHHSLWSASKSVISVALLTLTLCSNALKKMAALYYT
jgi:hypothetical protein